MSRLLLKTFFRELPPKERFVRVVRNIGESDISLGEALRALCEDPAPGTEPSPPDEDPAIPEF